MQRLYAIVEISDGKHHGEQKYRDARSHLHHRYTPTADEPQKIPRCQRHKGKNGHHIQRWGYAPDGVRPQKEAEHDRQPRNEKNPYSHAIA